MRSAHEGSLWDVHQIWRAIRDPRHPRSGMVLEYRKTGSGKDSLPGYTFSSTSERRVIKGVRAGSLTGLICVDVDDSSDPAGDRELLFGLPWCVLAFVSPSENGVKAVFRIEDTSEVRFDDAERSLHALVNLVMGREAADQAARGANRLCYHSFDPQARIRPWAEAQALPIWPFADREWSRVSSLDPSSYDDWVSAALHYRNCQDFLGEDTIREAWFRWSRSTTDPKHDTSDEALRAKWEQCQGDPERRHPAGEITMANDRNLRRLYDRCVERGWRVRRNMERMVSEVYTTEDGWRAFSDYDITDLRVTIQDVPYVTGDGKVKFEQGTQDEALAVLSLGPPVRPFRDYLDERAAAVDLSPREAELELREQISHALGLDPTRPTHAWVSQEFLVSIAVLRYHPGSMVDWAPVLVGEQGIGKSSFLEALFPQRLESYVNRSLSMDLRTHDRVQAVAGKALAIVNDMSGFTRAQRETLKAALTETSATVRFAYGRSLNDFVRTWQYAFTANDNMEVILPGDEDSRRFICVPVDPPEGWRGPEMRLRVAEHRDRWWGLAAAIARSRPQGSSAVPSGIYPHIVAANSAYASDNQYAESLDQLEARLRAEARSGVYYNLREIYTLLSEVQIATGAGDVSVPILDPTEYNPKRQGRELAAALTVRRFKRASRGGRQHVWIHRDDE